MTIFYLNSHLCYPNGVVLFCFVLSVCMTRHISIIGRVLFFKDSHLLYMWLSIVPCSTLSWVVISSVYKADFYIQVDCYIKIIYFDEIWQP